MIRTKDWATKIVDELASGLRTDADGAPDFSATAVSDTENILDGLVSEIADLVEDHVCGAVRDALRAAFAKIR